MNNMLDTLKSSVYRTLGLACLISVICGCSDKPANTIPETGPANPEPAMQTSLTTIIEAESMTVNGSFVKVELDDASADAALRIPEQAQCAAVTAGTTPKPIGSAKTAFDLSQSHAVNIWLRVKWTGTCSNSFTVVLPNGMKKTITSSTYNTWLWLPAVKNLKLEAGQHPIAVDAREFGTLVDQIFITDDLERTPRGIETDYSTLQ